MKSLTLTLLITSLACCAAADDYQPVATDPNEAIQVVLARMPYQLATKTYNDTTYASLVADPVLLERLPTNFAEEILEQPVLLSFYGRRSRIPFQNLLYEAHKKHLHDEDLIQGISSAQIALLFKVTRHKDKGEFVCQPVSQGEEFKGTFRLGIKGTKSGGHITNFDREPAHIKMLRERGTIDVAQLTVDYREQKESEQDIILQFNTQEQPDQKGCLAKLAAGIKFLDVYH